jgi:hypothetical protein
VAIGDTATATPTLTPSNPPADTPTVTPTPLAGRFVDNGDGTISDTETGLMWEKKDQAGGSHDASTIYRWSGRCSDDGANCQPDAATASTCSAATGGAIGCAQCAGAATCDTQGDLTAWSWLNQLNAASFAGHSDWRLPTVGQDGGAVQLETIADATVSGCGSHSPCVPPAFNIDCTADAPLTSCSCTQADFYWSQTSGVASPLRGRFFGHGGVAATGGGVLRARAVRGS